MQHLKNFRHRTRENMLYGLPKQKQKQQKTKELKLPLNG